METTRTMRSMEICTNQPLIIFQRWRTDGHEHRRSFFPTLASRARIVRLRDTFGWNGKAHNFPNGQLFVHLTVQEK